MDLTEKKIGKIVDKIINSYNTQIVIYKELQLIVQKILGKLALCGGDIGSVMGMFTEKQQLLEKTIKYREDIKDELLFWSSQKDKPENEIYSKKLDAVLALVEREIGNFIRLEDQLQFYFKDDFGESKHV